MYFRERGELRRLHCEEYTQVYPKGRSTRPGVRDLCALHVFVLRSEPRVFVGGGEWSFDFLLREADAVEIEALADRFNLAELREVLTRARPTLDEVTARALPPRRGGFFSFVLRLWSGRG